jgi:DNA-binding MarR family transcriptional regulator
MPIKPSKGSKKSVDLSGLPGHQIRRLQQIAVAIFLQETGETGLTPVQYAALQAAANQPDIDQRTLAGLVGLDTSTLAGVIDRLEIRGLVQRKPDARDRRLKLVSPTPEGHRALAQMVPAMLRAQERILAPLSKTDRREFTRMLDALVTANNDLSRAPSAGRRNAHQAMDRPR